MLVSTLPRTVVTRKFDLSYSFLFFLKNENPILATSHAFLRCISFFLCVFSLIMNSCVCLRLFDYRSMSLSLFFVMLLARRCAHDAYLKTPSTTDAKSKQKADAAKAAFDEANGEFRTHLEQRINARCRYVCVCVCLIVCLYLLNNFF